MELLATRGSTSDEVRGARIVRTDLRAFYVLAVRPQVGQKSSPAGAAPTPRSKDEQ